MTMAQVEPAKLDADRWTMRVSTSKADAAIINEANLDHPVYARDGWLIDVGRGDYRIADPEIIGNELITLEAVVTTSEI